MRVFVEGDGVIDWPNGLTFGPNGNLFVISFWDNSVLEFDGQTGALIGTFASGGGLTWPRDLTFGPNGNLFVLHTGVSGSPGGVLEFDGLTGAFVGDFVPLGSCGLSFANDFAFGPNGHLYVTHNSAGVFAFDGHTGTCIGGAPLIADPSGGFGGARFSALVFSSLTGNLLLPWGDDDPMSARVTEHDPADGTLIGTPIPPGLGQMKTAATATLEPSGHLFVQTDLTNLDGGADRIVEYDVVAGTFLGVFAGQGTLAGNGVARDIAFKPLLGDADGDWDVDADDAALFAACFTGQGGAPESYNCLIFDFDRDGDVDCDDWAAFQAAWTSQDPLPVFEPCVQPCPADLDGNGTVGASDLAQLLGSWGPCDGCPADFDNSGAVTAADLAFLLGAWGACS